MRLVRICHRSTDLPMVYMHSNLDGHTLCDGVSSEIKLTSPGQAVCEDCLCAVLTDMPKLHDGDSLYFGQGQCVLKKIGSRLEVAVPGFLSVSSYAEHWRRLTAGVLTVSDKGSRGERTDTAGPALCEQALSWGFDVIRTATVPDDMEKISSTVIRWCDENINLILCTGGTGLSRRDVTPEALASLAHRHVPGFGERMRAAGAAFTQNSYLTRGCAVTRNGTLVIAFPGSERGAVQCFEAIRPCLRHGVETLAGISGECGLHHHRH